MEESGGFVEAERQQIAHIRQLEFEELQIEEVDDDDDISDDDHHHHRPAATGTGISDELAFNTCLAPLHTYLGETENTHNRLAFLDGGAIFNLPLFYLEGIVLFPGAILPLRVVQSNFISAIERALTQVDAPYTIGVVRAYKNRGTGELRYGTIGTTAEIRQFRRLEDGSLNVVTRGQQRFRIRHSQTDVEGVPCGEVQIIQEDTPLRAPRDAFGRLAPFCGSYGCNISKAVPSNVSSPEDGEDHDNDSVNSEESFQSALSLAERRIHQSAIDGYDKLEKSTSSDDDIFESEIKLSESQKTDCDSFGSLHPEDEKKRRNCLETVSNAMLGKEFYEGESSEICWRRSDLNQFRRAPRAFWPYWVYRMYDAFSLAQRAADMWRQITGAPSMDSLVNKPDLLSFHIASKIPVSGSTRQELLEIDGISYRLRREIDLLKSFDLVRCKKCQTVIARRSDMLVMSSEGPLGAYVNPEGFVFEIMTFYRANGLALHGRASEEYSWFPGYAWTVTKCINCGSQMGWLFTATKKNLKPQSFWAVRSCGVADDIH
ncbi:ATP-dependent protease La (LON) domain protein [Euphorbia peplus]|nr:ATP-dependent protease La (LON) domain protein [Euphorbia peplus]